MATANAVEYHAFVAFDPALSLPPIGTIDEYRAGTWYAARLKKPAELNASFGSDASLPRSSDVPLDIADGPTGTYRTAAIGGAMNGTLVVVTLVMRETPPGGAPVEITRTQTLTITGSRLTRSGITLTLSDIEEKKLDALYPPLVWSATDWPQLSDGDAGKPICYPVGTALKLPCPQIVSDDANAQYWFGVCTGTPRLLTIASVNSGAKQITITGATLTGLVQVGQVVNIVSSSVADGRYTVAAINSTTVFTVVETLPASTGGSVRLMPHVLTVYRNGRVVDPSEYLVYHVYGAAQIVNGDFSTGTLSNWVVTQTGTGAATVSSGMAVLSATNSWNTCSITQNVTVPAGLVIAAGIDVDASSTAQLNLRLYSLAPMPVGRRTVHMRMSTSSAASPLRCGVLNEAGTVRLDNVRTNTTDLVALVFTRPQIDFQGSAYRIEADVLGFDSRNAADEVSRLLTAAGVTPDTTSITSARGVANTNAMTVDCDYGRAGQRTIRAILDDHLFLLRGCLYRNDSGNYVVVQDVAGASILSGDESLGDSLQVDSAEWPSKPTSVSVRYRPGSTDPGALQNTIERTVVGGSQGDETPRDLPYVRDHVAADRLLCYRALRAQYNATCKATIYRLQLDLGQVITLGSPNTWGATARLWSVRDIDRAPCSNDLTLLEYNNAVYTYTASPTLPSDAAATAYQPDYSQTPPAAPTALSIQAGAVALATDGTSTTWVRVRCTPPAVNWSQIWFVITHNVTGEIILGRGTDIGGGIFETTLTGLRPGNVYQLGAYAVNAFNLQGAIVSTFNAAAIGGGAAVTTFTAPGYATLPPNVASCTAQQGTGLIVQVSWPAVSMSSDILGDYILERKINSGAFAQVFKGRATSYTDRDFFSYGYGVAVQYRVRASDKWGNLSAAYATSSAFTLSASIYGGNGTNADIRNGTVDTVNRTNVSTIAVGFSTPTPDQSIGITHSLGRVPLVTYDMSGKVSGWVGIGNVTSTSVGATINQHYPFGPGPLTSTNNSVAGDPHTHNINYSWAVGSGTVRFYLW